MFFDISLIPLAVLILVGQLKKAPPRLLNNPSYQKEREQVLKHRRILDMLSLSLALILMIIHWGGPLLTFAYRAVIIWGFPASCIGSGRSSMCRVVYSSRVLSR